MLVLDAATSRVASFLSGVPKERLAAAAARCGAHARAVYYYETHMRETAAVYTQGTNIAANDLALANRTPLPSGGLNPASFFTRFNYPNATLSACLEVYGAINDVDGMAGLMALLPGRPTREEALAAAERAGDWGEVLAMHSAGLDQVLAGSSQLVSDSLPISSSACSRSPLTQCHRERQRSVTLCVAGNAQVCRLPLWYTCLSAVHPGTAVSISRACCLPVSLLDPVGLGLATSG